MKTAALVDELKQICNKSSVYQVLSFMQMNGLCSAEGKGVIKVDDDWKETVSQRMEPPKVGDIVFTFGRGTHLVIDTGPTEDADNEKKEQLFTGFKISPVGDGTYGLSPVSTAVNLEVSNTMRMRVGHFNMGSVKTLIAKQEKLAQDMKSVVAALGETKETSK